MKCELFYERKYFTIAFKKAIFHASITSSSTMAIAAADE
jgi:hypothetical protein